MTDINVSTAKPSALRYLSCLRPQDIVVLQGSPLLGAAFAIDHLGIQDIGPIAILFIANVLLVSHIFLLNDWSGLTADLADPNKAARVFTTRGVGQREMLGLTAGLLVASLILFTQLGAVPTGLALAIGILSALYSLPQFHWKGRPIFNSAAHMSGGVLHFLLGYSIWREIDSRGVATAMFFALIFTAGHLTQEIRDYEGDAVTAIRTNAVTFGKQRTFVASLFLFGFAHIIFLLLAARAILPRPLAVVVILYAIQLYWSFRALREGLTYESVSGLQTRYRVLYAVIGIVIVTALVAR